MSRKQALNRTPRTFRARVPPRALGRRGASPGTAAMAVVRRCLPERLFAGTNSASASRSPQPSTQGAPPRHRAAGLPVTGDALPRACPSSFDQPSASIEGAL